MWCRYVGLDGLSIGVDFQPVECDDRLVVSNLFLFYINSWQTKANSKPIYPMLSIIQNLLYFSGKHKQYRLLKNNLKIPTYYLIFAAVSIFLVFHKFLTNKNNTWQAMTKSHKVRKVTILPSNFRQLSPYCLFLGTNGMRGSSMRKTTSCSSGEGLCLFLSVFLSVLRALHFFGFCNPYIVSRILFL